MYTEYRAHYHANICTYIDGETRHADPIAVKRSSGTLGGKSQVSVKGT